MRLKLTLKQLKSNQTIPINYQYAISSFIYHKIESSDNEYSKWLHEKGFIDGNKRFKLFTFSILNIPERKFENDRLKIISENIELTISMFSDKTSEHFIIGLFENQSMKIFNRDMEADFLVKTVEAIPEPDFKSTMVFKTISPIVIKKNVLYNDKISSYFMSPEDEDYFGFFRKNLFEKYSAYCKTTANKINFTEEDILENLKIIGDVKSKKITVKENSLQQTEIRGFIYKFELSGDPEIIRFGYESGFGANCSMGFGCVAEIK